MNLAIIQARLGSTRLPNKVLMDLGDKKVIEHVVDRVGRGSFIDEIIVATTILKQDLSLVKFCSQRNIRVFVGSEDDVLDRYYQVAKLLQPVNVIRITSDCPLIDPEIIDLVGKHHVISKGDYTSNTLDETYPDGLDVEIMTFEALESAWKESTLRSEREHVTPFIKKNPDRFKSVSVRNETNLATMRWTLDQIEDYNFLSKIFERLYVKNRSFNTKDVLKEIANDPSLLKINGGIIRNEGYLKSLTKD